MSELLTLHIELQALSFKLQISVLNYLLQAPSFEQRTSHTELLSLNSELQTFLGYLKRSFSILQLFYSELLISPELMAEGVNF
jgi:hypothetical protein